MGEVVVVSDGGEQEEAKVATKWQSFMPRMTMRVLLVEADDSTRQIIASLLQKCGYKVDAVSDGLKAWELLKGVPCTIDLILTEVDLPSISGFALLTLAMEHDICRNLPVIMMSSQDSIGNVYKCMLKGAADYLVKPIRRNELQNLWQHVWRRQSIPDDGNKLPDVDGPASQKDEEPAEKKIASNGTYVGLTSSQRDKEFIGKRNEPQIGFNQEPGNASNKKLQKWVFMQNNPTGGLALSSYRTDLDLSLNNEVADDSCKEAIDLIGAFDNRADHSPHNSTANLHLWTKLDLSLKRSKPRDFDNSGTEERRPLKQSSASAFSRYTNNPWQLPEKKYESSARESTCINHDYYSEALSPSLSTPKSILSLPTSWSKHVDTPAPHQRQYPASVTVKVLRSHSPGVDFPLPSPSTASHRDQSSQVNVSRHFVRETTDNEEQQSTNHSNDQNVHNRQIPQLKLDPFVDHERCYLSADISAASSFVSESIRHLNCMDRRNGSETVNRDRQTKLDEGSNFTLDGISQQSLQRKAALMKFRMKRKARCFEKKVRYESRKKLAEQRPRVKGQFVRQTTFAVLAEEK
ncbi:hypothetical protein SAY86_022546 [Trapa natans]|uniref:Two-component response regulator-like APRR5 n=1 Tax=Trapa natans TaxID=22666 RepID=A0AAN7M8Y9_TRANT|nr:hypothetical protein SAY86_022546 [Trapa natans]